MMLEQYLQMYADLRTDKGRERYPKLTYHCAPHKPFLLLSIMDLIAQGRIAQNLIEPSRAERDVLDLLTLWSSSPGTGVSGRENGICNIRAPRGFDIRILKEVVN